MLLAGMQKCQEPLDCVTPVKDGYFVQQRPAALYYIQLVIGILALIECVPASPHNVVPMPCPQTGSQHGHAPAAMVR